MLPDKGRLKALFWSTPNQFLDNPAFSAEKTMTILCEGLAEDIGKISLQEIEASLEQRYFPTKVRNLWEEYFRYCKSREVMNMQLTPLQRQVLKILVELDVDSDFYFTGGTALSLCYLHHRESDDLDLFTVNEEAVSRMARKFEEKLRMAGLDSKRERSFQSTFVRLLIANEQKVDLAYDTPFRIRPATPRVVGDIAVPVDSIEDIAANKLLALFGRAATRDFIDVFFLSKEYFDFSEMVNWAAMKDTGLDKYWLAVAIQEADKIDSVPVRLLKSLDLQEMRRFYRDQRIKLLNSIAGDR
ncbi:MAG: nucleotidyl transferase AbiEii/AbiGii toxin family protein [Peptococcaceae bacterium]|nr:nucleotidyl transferase AbiEii/AbiGii toxin family protein [Peptococcaceae bacterium]